MGNQTSQVSWSAEKAALTSMSEKPSPDNWKQPVRKAPTEPNIRPRRRIASRDASVAGVRSFTLESVATGGTGDATEPAGGICSRRPVLLLGLDQLPSGALASAAGVSRRTSGEQN